MQRYFASKNSKHEIIIANDDIFHITKVMRMKKGDCFELNLDGDIYLCSVKETSPFSYEILEKKEENRLTADSDCRQSSIEKHSFLCCFS